MSNKPTNVGELLDLLGDPRSINDAINRCGYRPPSAGNIRVWRHRQIVPARWHIALIRVAAMVAPQIPSDHIRDLLSPLEVSQ